jgi:hypothetical protein
MTSHDEPRLLAIYSQAKRVADRALRPRLRRLRRSDGVRDPKSHERRSEEFEARLAKVTS